MFKEIGISKIKIVRVEEEVEGLKSQPILIQGPISILVI